MADSYYEGGISELALVLVEVAVKLKAYTRVTLGLLSQPEVQNVSDQNEPKHQQK